MATFGDLRVATKVSPEGTKWQDAEKAKKVDGILARAEAASATLAECAAELGALNTEKSGSSKELGDVMTTAKSRIDADLAQGIIKKPAEK